MEYLIAMALQVIIVVLSIRFLLKCFKRIKSGFKKTIKGESEITNKKITEERIVNSKNNTLGDVFIKDMYPDYKLEIKRADGNDYVSSYGDIIRTRYVTRVETKVEKK